MNPAMIQGNAFGDLVWFVSLANVSVIHCITKEIPNVTIVSTVFVLLKFKL